MRKTDLKQRVDLRDVPLITIDGEDARDFDDAVYCEPVELGTGQRKRPAWRLLVAIADVSNYVWLPTTRSMTMPTSAAPACISRAA